MATRTSKHTSKSAASSALNHDANSGSDAASPFSGEGDSGISNYLKAISRFERLSAPAELEIGREIQSAQRNLRQHLRRSGFGIRLAATLALTQTNQKRIGSRGSSNADTAAHAKGLNAAIEACQDAYTRGLGFEKAFMELDVLCERFPLKPRLYSHLIEALASELHRLSPTTGGELEAAVPGFCQQNWMTLSEAVEHLEVARRLEARWLAAREVLVNANLRLVVSVAKKHQSRGLSLEDLIQAGNESLLKTADSFNPARGCRFSTHATTHLQGDLRREIDDAGRLVRIPVHICEKIRKVEGKSKELSGQIGGAPSVRLLARETGMSAETVQDLMGIKQAPLSIHQPAGDDQNQTLESTLEAQRTAAPEEEEEHLEVARQRVRALFGFLKEIERAVLSLSYGLEEGAISDEDEIADQLGVKRAKVAQIRQRAISRLHLAAHEQQAA